ncbi:TetR/AcrR family transcriptional regulator [Nocardia pseudobrasiliensis]|uniref:TetR family transcriptional regulator n=1 Tax=Nocardia pseudobrasiliensis TaxID=45979 RepID=A0A370I4C8_9NOCA|nr:TetR/AcrR family transcriptional regulator [Nocardia pseudobrasiliensis]RDI65586.1 TetR family transcriptional regulator [Nocardia pseudobrasiliensis]
MARAPIGRQQLLDAAREALVSGNGNLELSALTRSAGLSTGALYHHFGSKAGLLAAIYDGFYDGLAHAIADAHLPQAVGWGARERERTRRFVAYHFGDPLAPLLLNRAAPVLELTELEGVYVRAMSDAAAHNIREGQETGQIPASIDPDSAGAYVIGGLRHGIAQQLRLTPRPTVEQATDRLWRLTGNALGIV